MKVIKQRFVIDESISMSSQQHVVISGFNEQLDTMRKEETQQGVKYLVSLTKFSDTVTLVFKDLPLEKVQHLTTETYSPQGSTALLDAIGQTIDTALPGETDVVVTIFTDGQENASRQWKTVTIKTLIELRQKDNKWGFVFFGANQDAWTEAQNLGIANAVNYTMQNTGAAFTAMNCVRSAYTMSAVKGDYNVSNLTANVNLDELTK
jgi:hypothetical protein